MKRLTVVLVAALAVTGVLFWPSLTMAGEGDEEDNGKGDNSTGASTESDSTRASKSQYDVHHSKGTHKEGFSTEEEDTSTLELKVDESWYPDEGSSGVIIDTETGSSKEENSTNSNTTSSYDVDVSKETAKGLSSEED